MVSGKGFSIKFEKSLIFAALLVLFFGPGWIHRTMGIAGTQSWLVTLLAALSILLGVLIHELGHAGAARLRGVSVEKISLSWWGGSTALGPARFLDSALIALAGPLINGLYALALWLLADCFASSWVSVALLLGAWINIFLTVFNLLPLAPLDGSHLVSDLLAAATGSRQKGERTVAWIGLAAIPLGLAWFVLKGGWYSWWDLLIAVGIVGMVWNFSFNKLKQVDASAKSGFLASMIARPVEFLPLGSPVSRASGEVDVLLLAGQQPTRVVPSQLIQSLRDSSSQILVLDQISLPLASKTIPATITPIDLNEFAQGHFLVAARQELGELTEPIWLIKEHEAILGVIHHQDLLTAISR